jgi:hypothetical protein
MLNILKTHSKLPFNDLFVKVYENKNLDKDAMLREMAMMSFNA